MSKLLTGDGRTHIASNLMRESLASTSNRNLLLDQEIRHDLRNKVAVVKGFSDLMLDDAPDGHPSIQVLDQIVARSRQFVGVLDQAKAEASEDEEDQLDNAPGLEPESRLGCQCVPDGTKDVVVEIPDWNRNLVREDHH